MLRFIPDNHETFKNYVKEDFEPRMLSSCRVGKMFYLSLGISEELIENPRCLPLILGADFLSYLPSMLLRFKGNPFHAY